MNDPLDIDCNPPRPGPEMYVRRLRADQSLTVTIISDSLWGIWTHWDGKRSSPHHRNAKNCPGCKAGAPKRWKGYLHVGNANNHAQEFLELTPIMAQQLLDLCGRDAPLRGQRASFTRGKGDKARVKVAVLSHVSAFKDHPTLPPAKDPQETLCLLWGLADLKFYDPPDFNLPMTEVG